MIVQFFFKFVRAVRNKEVPQQQLQLQLQMIPKYLLKLTMYFRKLSIQLLYFVILNLNLMLQLLKMMYLLSMINQITTIHLIMNDLYIYTMIIIL